MKQNTFVIGLTLLFISTSHAFTCDRTPKKAENPRPNKDRYVIEITGNPESYSPEEIYTVVLKSVPFNPERNFFSEFMLVVEPELPAENINNVLSGDLIPVDSSIARFTPKCPNAVIQTNSLAKQEVQIFWRAPPTGNGCVAIKATVFESSDSWFTDDGGLTKIICEEKENEDVQPPVLAKCEACNEAKYEVAFQGMWTRNTHPKDYPPNMWTTKLGEVIGASHKHSKSFWNYDSKASDGLKLLAEEGNTSGLEDELKEMVKNDDIRTIIKARELSYPNISDTSYTVFRVDQQHHLVSLVSKITPSPDWVVGVANLELCTENMDWLESRTLNLYPWDVGTDSGNSYSSPDSRTNPPGPIRMLTSADEDTPFYDEDGKPVKPIAKLKVTRQKLYEKKCEPNEESDNNCELNKWSPWSNCSTTCGNRVMTRDRTFVEPENEEKCTEDGSVQLQQTEHISDCNEHDSECEVTKCVNATWSEWSPCSVTCGSGIKTRNGTVENTEEESEECSETVECYTLPCEGEEPTTESSHLPISSENQVTLLTEGPSFNPVVDCKASDWSEWGPCRANPCFTGYQYRERHIEVHPSNGGKACPKRLQKHRRCRVPCEGEVPETQGRKGSNGDVDCVLGPWSKWSPCSSNCGFAVRQRTRNIEVYPKKGGKPCGPRLEVNRCPLPYACNDGKSLNLNRF